MCSPGPAAAAACHVGVGMSQGCCPVSSPEPGPLSQIVSVFGDWSSLATSGDWGKNKVIDRVCFCRTS